MFDEGQNWKVKITNWLFDLGFVAVGFTGSKPIEGLDLLLQTRFEQNMATPFENKEIRLRVDPKAVWQDCKGIAALAYPLPHTVGPVQGEGVLARSAVGGDYHRVVNQRLKELSEKMVADHWPGELRWQVDTGPLVERAFALRAGIGWIGRNQQLIIPGYGSFVSLALLLLDREIPSDEEITNQCGNCRKCVQVCPAQILGKELFAAQNCYSYLTQSKDVLAMGAGQGLGLRIFGCDTCQEVCPYNQTWLQEELKDLSPARPKRGVDLLTALSMTKGEFKKDFFPTAAGWRGKGVLQRNAFLAMRQAQDPRLNSWLTAGEKSQMPPILTPYLQDNGEE
ncbi:tRNA epoxyqueuosine(34) reductase QueG [Desulfosporosinus sp. PR]|uniref:tRNA epoxyqueuosine(34) reductase QueG n=1 Tax=Candidatus Desulfosporosinus nitrosoreducens TaxID=3401928 RepID=UPI0027EED0B0|nr:tRNA epoxyqueuosine(34) reductase QueG [Desulfosporosinus sp. PR]MDQ7092561.1 tRNA epoxyqueuosine(34) reductase QueG [Desulfosporosinus sp. PR]